ncbi:hypothetical protein [Pseudoclavibacter sp. CFCC 11306]|uniref:hypothetical protein n=1 Tax=Pseudoclavibacter sp. CFCC 11306 TaxID=1564493 RepID=UPI001300F6AF|nr:hypothetical protein [Pseudoclavibacter sp. CFCC 11306]KAB1658876.1 hypothetical protein F8O09_04705 [Pseudoclavibacter sp. CFCC 11306]
MDDYATAKVDLMDPDAAWDIWDIDKQASLIAEPLAAGTALLSVLDGDRSVPPLSYYSNATIKELRKAVQYRVDFFVSRSAFVDSQRTELQRHSDAVAPSPTGDEATQDAGVVPAPQPTAKPSPAPAPKPAPKPDNSSAGVPGKRPSNAAPCRKYAPGGKSFTYIDCVTKQPI